MTYPVTACTATPYKRYNDGYVHGCVTVHPLDRTAGLPLSHHSDRYGLGGGCPTGGGHLQCRRFWLSGRSHHPPGGDGSGNPPRSEEHTSELQSRGHLVCRLLLEKKKYYKK